MKTFGHPVGIRLPLVAALALIAGCPPSDTTLLGPEVAPVRIVESFASIESDAFSVDSHRLDGDILEIDVTYSGGCQTHEFEGLVGSAIAESLPVQMSGTITHNDRDDPCDSVVSGTIAFDLSPVRAVHQAAYGPGAATVTLHLDPIAVAIHYSF